MITIIEGPAKSGKSALANSMRNTHIGMSEPFDPKNSKGWSPYGALLIDEDQDGEPRHLIEKLLHGDALPANGEPVKAATLNWKTNPSVIIVGAKKAKLLDEFEKLVPGFMAKVGPVKHMKLSNG